MSPLPVAAFNATNVCQNSPSVFTDASTGFVTSWDWNFGDATAHDATQNPTHIYAAAGNFTVTLIVMTGSGCSDTISQNVTVYPIPVPNFTATSVCLNNPTVFTDNSNIASGTITGWTWTFGDASANSNLQNPTHSYVPDGTYNVQLVVVSDQFCTDSITLPVTVYPLPLASFSADTVCPNQVTTFTDLSSVTSGNVTGWAWDFADGGTSNVQNPTHTYTTSGTFNVQLIITTNNGCLDTVVVPVIVSPLPVAAFTTGNGCLNVPTAFTDNSIGALTSWDWDFGDATTHSALQNPNHTYTVDGTYNVTLIVFTGANCSDTITQTVTIYPLPAADFTFTNVCLNVATAFTDISIIASGNVTGWDWDFGDASAHNLTQNPTHTYAVDGTYTVTLIVTSDNNCTDTVAHQITVYPLPTALFIATTVCPFTATVFTDQSSVTSGTVTGWLYDFADAGNTSALQNPTYTYSVSGIYNVSLTATTNNGCTGTVIVPVTVSDVPVAAFAFTNVCQGQQTVFTDQSNIGIGVVNGWDWDFGDASAHAIIQNPQHIYAAPGTYNVTMIAFSGTNCSDTLTQQITVYDIPVANFVAPSGCLNTLTSFTDASNIAVGNITNWDWNFGDGTPNSNQQNPSHTYGSVNTFNVTLTVTSNHGCTNSFTTQVTVYPLPVASFTALPVCEGFATVFSNTSTVASGSIITTAWSFGDLTPNGNTFSLMHTYATPGNFNAEVWVTTDHGCRDSLIQIVTVNPTPQINFSADVVSGCAPLLVNFSDLCQISSGTITAWQWNLGDTVHSSDQNPIHFYQNPGTFTVTLTATSAAGCSATMINSNMIVVHPVPIAGFSVTPYHTTMLDPHVVIDDESTGATFWSYVFGEGGTSGMRNPQYTYTEPGAYFIIQIVRNNFGCSDTAYRSVIIDPDFDFFVPSAFTPNHDGRNDNFFGVGHGIKEYQMLIFDRWGSQIFECRDMDLQWDGTIGGTDAKEDIYVYMITIEDIFGKGHKYYGKVSLIR